MKIFPDYCSLLETLFKVCRWNLFPHAEKRNLSDISYNSERDTRTHTTSIRKWWNNKYLCMCPFFLKTFSFHCCQVYIFRVYLFSV